MRVFCVLFFGISNVYPVLFEPLLLVQTKQKHVLLPSTFSPKMRTQLSLHGDSLHSAERIKSVSSSQIGKNSGKGVHCHKVVAWLFGLSVRSVV